MHSGPQLPEAHKATKTIRTQDYRPDNAKQGHMRDPLHALAQGSEPMKS